MAKDVDDALTAIIRTHGGLSDEAAHDYKRELVADETLRARRVLISQFHQHEGDQYQDITNFTCSGSTVDQKPVLLTCVSDQGELVVSAV